MTSVLILYKTQLNVCLREISDKTLTEAPPENIHDYK